jgi:hypothetical protein
MFYCGVAAYLYFFFFSPFLLPIPAPGRRGETNEPPQGKPCGIEDLTLKSSAYAREQIPRTPSINRPKGRGIKPHRATPLINVGQKEFLHLFFI